MSRTLVVFAFVLAAQSSSAAAQQTAGGDERSILPFLGFALGGGPFPGALDPECHSGFEGRTPAGSGDVRGGVSIGALRLETRSAAFASVVFEDCYFTGPAWFSGVHTDRVPATDRGGFKLTDLRAGYVLDDGPFYLMVSGGAGWIWGRDVPVVMLGTGIGLGRRIRLIANVDGIGYRIPWQVVTAEWQDGAIVRELESRREHDWRFGYTVRLGIEIARGTSR